MYQSHENSLWTDGGSLGRGERGSRNISWQIHVYVAKHFLLIGLTKDEILIRKIKQLRDLSPRANYTE
jgi:hypothetical protein